MRFIKNITVACDWSSKASIAAIGVYTFIDVLARYLFNKPFTGSNEVLEILMAFLITSSMAIATKNDSHISVSLFESWIKSNDVLNKAVSYLIKAICFISFAGLSFWMMNNTLVQFRAGMTTELLHIPMWIIGVIISFFMVLTTVVTLFNNTLQELDL